MKIAIAGYGNLGKEIEKQALECDNIELLGIFTRRNTVFVKSKYNTPVYSFFDINQFAEKIDVMLVCMKSENDLPVISPYIAKHFNFVDCYEIGEKMEIHKSRCDKYAKETKKLAVVGCGLNSFLIPLTNKSTGLFDFPPFDLNEEEDEQSDVFESREIKGRSEIKLTASVMLYYASWASLMNKNGSFGCKTAWELDSDFPI